MNPLTRLLPVAFLAICLAAPKTALAQEDDSEAEENVFETDDGQVTIERDTDGDRPGVGRRIIQQPNRMRLRREGGRGNAGAHRHGEIIFRDEDGNERRFSMDGAGMQWHGDDDAALTDTTIDGKRVIIIRTPDGEEEVVEIGEMGDNAFSFHMPDFDMPDFERDLESAMQDGHEMRFRMFGDDGANAFAFAPNFRHLEGMMNASPESRRELMELERRSIEIASRLREEHDAGLERELDDVLGQVFVLRGQAREERARHMEEEAEQMRQEAQELRESLNERNRDRSELIEKRKRELLGDRGSDW